jgi:Tol biopolymer transport system component
MALDGTGISYLPQDGSLMPLSPDVSPDGREIVFYDQYGRVKVQAVDNSDSLVVSPPGFQCAFPAWSPDGGRIAMQCPSASGSDRDIYVVDRDGSGFGPLVTSPGSDNFPTWSPDGRRIAYSSTRDGNPEIYLRDLETGRDSNLTGTPDVQEELPVWSPDGRYIAFNSRSGILENRSIELLEVRTGLVRRLVDRLQASYFPDWSPDGKHLAFAQNQLPDILQIVKVNASTGTITAIMPADDAVDRDPTYAPASGWP